MILHFHQEVSGSRTYNERSVSWDEVVPRLREPSEFKGRRRAKGKVESGNPAVVLCVHHRALVERKSPGKMRWVEAEPGWRCTTVGCWRPADAEGVRA